MDKNQEFNIKVDKDIFLHVESVGDGPSILISNNFFMNQDQWKNIGKTLRKYYRVITYDLRGQGKSSDSLSPVTARIFSNDIGEIIDYLNLDQVVLLGLYESTAFCRDYALENPAKVESLILVSPIFSAFGNISRSILTKSMIRCLNNSGEDALFDYFYPLFYTPRSIENYGSTGYLALKNSFVSRNSKIQLLNKLNCLDEIVFGPDILKDLHTDTLLICGEDDFLTRVTDLEVMCRIMPDATWETIKMAGHTPHIESPVEFCRVVKRFIDNKYEQKPVESSFG